MSEKNFKILVERKRIKNIYLRITPEGYLKITAPKRVSDREILEFLNSRSDWINRTLHKQEERIERSFLYRGGDVFYIFGEPYKLIRSTGRAKLEIRDRTVYLTYKDEEGIDYLYSKMNSYLARETERLMNKYLPMLRDYGYHLTPELRYRKMKSKWGLCYTRKNSITVNSYLIHYPIECLEYVVLHEMCHFIVPNHSKRFYSLIENRIPDYKRIKAMLV